MPPASLTHSCLFGYKWLICSVSRMASVIGTRQLPTAELELCGSTAYLLSSPGRGVSMIAYLINITRIYNAVSAGEILSLSIPFPPLPSTLFSHPPVICSWWYETCSCAGERLQWQEKGLRQPAQGQPSAPRYNRSDGGTHTHVSAHSSLVASPQTHTHQRQRTHTLWNRLSTAALSFWCWSLSVSSAEWREEKVCEVSV